jgi:hypothetical protein
MLLTAVGIDANNNLFSIAEVVMCTECTDAREWFLTILKQDLNIMNNTTYTLISNEQKGLIQAFL